MNSSSDENLDKLKKFINELADVAYKKEKCGVLLSRVGEVVTKQKPELRRALENRKLLDFIKTELADSVHVLTSPSNSIVRVILPRNVSIAEGDIMSFFPKRGSITGSDGVRYNHALWAAFSRPLQLDYVRHVGFQPQVHFTDVKDGSPEAHFQKTISPNLIVSDETMPDRIGRIHENIKSWLRENAVSIDSVLDETKSGRAVTRIDELRKKSLLDMLLDTLDSSDLERIQMPLDIVSKLNNRFV